MSARSSLPETILVVLACAGCGKAAKKPEADPAKVTDLAKKMLQNTPRPAGVRPCELPEVLGGATLTQRTLIQLGHDKFPDQPEIAEYVNPTDLDSPAARTLAEATADAGAQRQAAAELLAAPFYLVYHVDLIDAPMALGVKDFKRPTVGARAIRYDKTGAATCVLVFFWAPDPAKQEWAVKQSDKAMIDPAVKLELQKDLTAQMLLRVAALGAPAQGQVGPADDRTERTNPK